MKTILLSILFPAISWSITPNDLKILKSEKIQFAAVACEENSYLRGCFQVADMTCEKEVKKSYDSCFKFIEKRIDTAKLTTKEWAKKLDSCVLREVALQLKPKNERNPVCALPEKEVL